MDSCFQKNDNKSTPVCMSMKMPSGTKIRENNGWLRFLERSGELIEIFKICNCEVQILDVGLFSF